MPAKKKTATKAATKVARKKPTKPAAENKAKKTPKADKPKADKAAKSKKSKIDEAAAILDDVSNFDAGITTFRPKFDDESLDTVTKRHLVELRRLQHMTNAAKSKRMVNIYTPDMLRKVTMPIKHIYRQYAMGATGLRYPGVMMVVGPEAAGKTAFFLHEAGNHLRNGCPVIYIDCEGKLPADKWAMRLLDRSPERAKFFYNRIAFAKVRELNEFEETLVKALVVARNACDADPMTKGNPIFVYIDTWSTLMAPAQAAGRYDWGKGPKDKVKQKKDADTASNFGHSKYANWLKRFVPAVTEKYNAMLVFGMHQTEAISMSPGARPTPRYMNANTIGGKALKQIASYILVQTPAGDLLDSAKRTVGIHSRFYVTKNSYGAPKKSFYVTIHFGDLVDRPDYLDDPIDYHTRTAEWLASEGHLGVRLYEKKYSCESLRCTAVSAETLYARLLESPDVMGSLGSALEIEGYDTSASRRLENALKGVPKTPPADEASDDDEGDDADDEDEDQTDDDDAIEE